MNIALRLAASTLRAAGYTILPPHPPPEIGQVWTPTRTDALSRRVVWVSASEVTYRVGDTERTCRISTWEWWVRHTRAKVCG